MYNTCMNCIFCGIADGSVKSQLIYEDDDVVAFKDFVKFPDNWRDILTKDVYVLSVNLKIRGGEEEFNKFTDVLYPKFSKIKNK